MLIRIPTKMKAAIRKLLQSVETWTMTRNVVRTAAKDQFHFHPNLKEMCNGLGAVAPLNSIFHLEHPD